MPADTPCVVMKRPLSTKRSPGTTVTRGNFRSDASAPKCVVALSPSSRPALASAMAPVHTDMVSSAVRVRSLIHVIIFGFS
jgi:hypothetical protein